MVETEAESGVCSRCGGSGWVLVERDGTEVASRCDCAEAERRRRLLEHARIPQRYRHCSLNSFEVWNPADPTLASAQRQVRDFVDGYPDVARGLLLMGGVGTGKTHLAVAALVTLIEAKGVSGRFADFTSLIQEMQLTFDGSGGARQILDPLLHTQLLVLDELGSGKSTPWVMDLLYYLVNTRYLEQRLTIFTTNFSDFPKVNEESLADRVSARIRSRLYEMCTRIELRGDDYRAHAFGKRKRAGKGPSAAAGSPKIGPDGRG